jgi:predicted RNA-binding Zn-ribbon protein involved in translation (DUF1610 family)
MAKKNEQLTLKCKNCGKKVEIAHYSTFPELESMLDVEKAPCKDCGEENIISTTKRSRGPAEVDLLNPTEIVQYFRDLFNISDLLGNELDTMMLNFTRKLSGAGWGEVQIHQFITTAGYGTRYDELQDSLGYVVERPLPQRGDWKEWRRIKARLK